MITERSTGTLRVAGAHRGEQTGENRLQIGASITGTIRGEQGRVDRGIGGFDSRAMGDGTGGAVGGRTDIHDARMGQERQGKTGERIEINLAHRASSATGMLERNCHRLFPERRLSIDPGRQSI